MKEKEFRTSDQPILKGGIPMPENYNQTNDPRLQNSAGRYMPDQTNMRQQQHNHPGEYPQGSLQTSNVQPHIFCTACGQQLDMTMKFCPRCAKATNRQLPQASVPPAGAVPPMPQASVPPVGATPPMPQAGVPPAGAAPPVPQAGVPPAGAAPPVPQSGVPPAEAAPPMPQSGVPPAGAIQAALPEKVRQNCAVCNQPTSDSDIYVSVISGIQTNIGKSKDRKDLYHKEPNLSTAAPICSHCKDDGIRKIKKMRVSNCILAILFWPIGIALLIGGIVLFFSDYLWIPLGNFQIKPYVFAFILCIPGIIVISLASRFGKRGFSRPEKILVLDSEEKLKTRILSELTDAGVQKSSVFAATAKEAANIQRQNIAARNACKYPSSEPVQPIQTTSVYGQYNPDTQNSVPGMQVPAPQPDYHGYNAYASANTYANAGVNAYTSANMNTQMPVSTKSRTAAITLASIPYTGWLGINRFYLGRFWTGLFKLLVFIVFIISMPLSQQRLSASGAAVVTGAFSGIGFMVWYIIDIVRSVNCSIKDRHGRLLQRRNAYAPMAPVAASSDELLKYSDLLSRGLITREEFDKKKADILGYASMPNSVGYVYGAQQQNAQPTSAEMPQARQEQYVPTQPAYQYAPASNSEPVAVSKPLSKKPSNPKCSKCGTSKSDIDKIKDKERASIRKAQSQGGFFMGGITPPRDFFVCLMCGGIACSSCAEKINNQEEKICPYCHSKYSSESVVYEAKSIF